MIAAMLKITAIQIAKADGKEELTFIDIQDFFFLKINFY